MKLKQMENSHALKVVNKSTSTINEENSAEIMSKPH